MSKTTKCLFVVNIDRMNVLSELALKVQEHSGKEVSSFDGIETLDYLRQLYGLDSLDFIEIVMSLEDRFDIDLSDKELEELFRLDDLIDLVVKKANGGYRPEQFTSCAMYPAPNNQQAANPEVVINAWPGQGSKNPESPTIGLPKRSLFPQRMDEETTNKLAAFLYFLMRDHVPVGIVPKIIEDIPSCELVFTNEDLYNIALRYAKMITP